MLSQPLRWIICTIPTESSLIPAVSVALSLIFRWFKCLYSWRQHHSVWNSFYIGEYVVNSSVIVFLSVCNQSCFIAFLQERGWIIVDISTTAVILFFFFPCCINIQWVLSYKHLTMRLLTDCGCWESWLRYTLVQKQPLVSLSYSTCLKISEKVILFSDFLHLTS